MRNVILTDIRRAQRKKSLIICMIIMIVMAILIAVGLRVLPMFSDNPSDFYISGIGNFSSFFSPLLIGIPIFSAIYTDDFKSRSMQIAIGRGVSRPKMMLARFIETIILVVEWHVIFTIVAVICGLIDGASGSLMASCIGTVWTSSIKMIVFLSLSLLFVYGTQNPTTGLVFYIIFVANVLDIVFTFIDMIPFLQDNNIELSKFFPGSACNNFINAISEGDALHAFSWGIGVVVGYIILPLIISIQIFKKKELEF